MPIIIKFILNSIREKKLRTFLILLSITLSTALFFASMAISGSIESMYMQRIRKDCGNADIIIHAQADSPSWCFSNYSFRKLEDRFVYSVGVLETNGKLKINHNESVDFYLRGSDLDDMQLMSPLVLKQQKNLLPFTGNKIIINSVTATRYGLKPGDPLNLEVFGNRHRFLIAGIAQPKGFFQDDGSSIRAVAVKDFLCSFIDARGRASLYFIKAKHLQEIPGLIGELSKVCRRYTVRETFSRSELTQFTNNIATPLRLMVIVILFMSIFIIFTSFKVIARERMPVIGTFRSVGATRKMTNGVLFAESTIYGIIGGIIGCVFGVAILYIMTVLMTPSWLKGTPVSISFNILHLIEAFLLAVLLTLLSALIPIIRVAQIPVKNIILGQIEFNNKRRSWLLPLGLALLVLTMVIPRIAPKEAAEVALFLDIAAMILLVGAVIILIPHITRGFIKICEWFYIRIFGNEGVLAVKNLRDNKSILNNIGLLAIGISSLLMINTASFSVEHMVLDFYHNYQFDIWMYIWQADRNTVGIARTADGVKDVYGLFNTNNVEVVGRQTKISLLYGINEKFLDYWETDLGSNPGLLLTKLAENRNILVSNILKEKLNLNPGDPIMLQMKKGKRVYRIIGFFNSMMNNGSFALIGERHLKADMQEQYYQSLFIKTRSDPDMTAQALRKKFQRRWPWISTVKSLREQSMQSNNDMFFILRGFSLLALLIGIVGVLNNLLISFIEQQRSFAILRSVGMSKRQITKMIFIESFTSGMLGGIIGVLAGLIMIDILPQITMAINSPLKVQYSTMLFLNSLVSGIIITIVASISPAFKSVKLNIIKAIKYE